MERDNRIKEIIETALNNINSFIDVNTVIGNPIKKENGDYIIPFSKVTLGVLVGGGEYGKLTIFKKNSDLPYSAGNGAIISITPCGFLINEKNGEVKVLSCKNTSYEKIIDKATEIFDKIKYEKNED